MHPELERLAQIDGIDRQRRQAKAALDAERAAHQAAQAAATTRDAELAAHQASLAKAKESEHALNRKLHLYKERRASAVRILETGAGDPNAAERQLAQCDEIIDTTETEVLELMEVQDATQRAIDAAKTAVEQARAHLATLDAKLGPRTGELQASLDALASERVALLATLEAPVRARYEELVTRKGTAVSTIEGGFCKACRMLVQPQHLTDLQRGLIVPCRGCNRWLVP